MQSLLEWLDGKKSTILLIASAINTYCMAGGLYNTQLGALIQTILSVLAGGAKLVTADMQGQNRLGFRK